MARVKVEVIGDVSSVNRAFKQASEHARGFEKAVERGGRGALAASGAFHHLGRSIAFASGSFLGAAGLTEVTIGAIENAAKLQKELEKTTIIFGKSADGIKQWSKTTASSLGLARNESLKAVNSFGQMFKVLGIGRIHATEMALTLTKLAPKLALFAGKDVATASSALTQALAGRTRGLRQFGIVIDAVAVKAEALRLGLIKSTVDTNKVAEAQTRYQIALAKAAEAQKKYGDGTTQVASANNAVKISEDALKRAMAGKADAITLNQKALATYSLITQQAKNANETWRKEQGSEEVQLRRLKAELKDAQTTIGQALLPSVVHLTKGIADWLAKTKNQERIQRDANQAVKIGKEFVGALKEVVHALAPIVKTATSAVGGLKHAFEILIALALVTKLNNIAGAIGLVGRQAAIAGGEAGVGGLATKLGWLSRLGPIAITIMITYDIIKRGSGFLDSLPGAGFVDKYLGGNWLNKKLGFTDGKKGSHPKGMTPKEIGQAYGADALGAAVSGAASGKVKGHSGPITPGLAAVEQATGAKVYDDYATSGHAKHSYHYRGEAVDLAPDPNVWRMLLAHKEKFAELLGPWGLYNWGVKFYNSQLQSQHKDHIHVAYTGGPGIYETLMRGGTPPPNTLSGAGSGADSGAGSGGLTVGSSSKSHKPKWVGATEATIISARASVTAMVKEAMKAIGGVAGPMDDVERNAIDHINKLKAHLRIHMSAADLAATKANISKWGKILKDEVSKQTKEAQRAFDRAKNQLLRNFDRETQRGLDALAAPAMTPAEQQLQDLQDAHDEASRQQALADAQASGDAQQIADALYEIQVAALEKQAKVERDQADKDAAARQQQYQDARDDQRTALENQLDDWNDWLTNKKKTWNSFWAWIKANPHGGEITPPNVGDTSTAPTFWSPSAADTRAGQAIVRGGFPGGSSISAAGLGPNVHQMATGGIVRSPTFAMIGEKGPEAVIPLNRMNGAGGYGIIENHIVVELDGQPIWSGLKRHAIRDQNRNGTTGIR